MEDVKLCKDYGADWLNANYPITLGSFVRAFGDA